MTSKIDGRLVREIHETMQRGKAEGKTPEELTMVQYPVTIELKQALMPRTREREEALRELKKRAEETQASVINALEFMGVKDFQLLPLSNSIKVKLTAEQIERITMHEEVKIVRLIKAEKVTL